MVRFSVVEVVGTVVVTGILLVVVDAGRDVVVLVLVLVLVVGAVVVLGGGGGNVGGVVLAVVDGGVEPQPGVSARAVVPSSHLLLHETFPLPTAQSATGP